MFISQDNLIYVDTYDNTEQISLIFEMAFIYQTNLSKQVYIFSILIMAIKMLVRGTPKAVIFYWTFWFFKHL